MLHLHFAGVTLPPPPNDICRQHQKRFDEYETEEYDRRCSVHVLEEKASNGTLELNDLYECYEPHCQNFGTEYSNHQCSYNVPEWCWCSDATGLAIQGTLSNNLGSKQCGKLLAHLPLSLTLVNINRQNIIMWSIQLWYVLMAEVRQTDWTQKLTWLPLPRSFFNFLS